MLTVCAERITAALFWIFMAEDSSSEDCFTDVKLPPYSPVNTNKHPELPGHWLFSIYLRAQTTGSQLFCASVFLCLPSIHSLTTLSQGCGTSVRMRQHLTIVSLCVPGWSGICRSICFASESFQCCALPHSGSVRFLMILGSMNSLLIEQKTNIKATGYT